MSTGREDMKVSQRGWRGIHRYAYAARPFEDIWPLFGNAPARAFGAIHRAEGEGLELRIRRAGVDLPRTVLLDVGGLVHVGERALVPVSWSDFDRPRLFPVLKAVLELAPADYRRQPITQIGLLGRYRPPLGPLGGAVDRLAGGDVVAESVATFVDDLAARIEADLAPTVVAGGLVDEDDTPVEPPWRRIFLPIGGLRTRPGGALGLRRLLAGVPGVRVAEVDPLAALALVEYAPDICDLDELVACGEADWSDAAVGAGQD